MTNHHSRNHRLVALFLLGFALMNYPLLSMFNLPRMIGGIPLLYAYVFTVWMILVILVGLVMRPRRRPADPVEKYED